MTVTTKVIFYYSRHFLDEEAKVVNLPDRLNQKNNAEE